MENPRAHYCCRSSSTQCHVSIPFRGDSMSSRIKHNFVDKRQGSHVPINRLTRDQATYMPDTAPTVNRSRRNSSRSLLTNRGFVIVYVLFDIRNGDSLSFFFSDVT